MSRSRTKAKSKKQKLEELVVVHNRKGRTQYRYIVECRTCKEATMCRTMKEFDIWAFEHMADYDDSHLHYNRYDNWRDCYQ